LLKILKKTLLIVFLFFPLLTPLAYADEGGWTDVVGEIEAVLQSAEQAYEEGRSQEAKSSVSRAYFDIFEGSGMESAISVHLSPARKTELESIFGSVRGAIGAKKPLPDVKKRTEALVAALTRDAAKLPPKGGANGRPAESPYSLFFNSFIIILREGFEAILVISALTAYLTKSGHRDKTWTVYKGALIALVASIITAVVLQKAINISGAGREALEGITMLVATAVLFYVSYWLISKMEVARWQHYIKSRIDNSLSNSNVLALGFAAFLSVYREGAETVLFYQVLHSSSDGNSEMILAGFALGVVILAGVFLLVKYGSVKVPLAPFFAVTSALLYYLAFSFAGRGILELQEAEWISSTPIDVVPTVTFLGIYPTLQGITLQGVMLLALIIALAYSFILRPIKEKATAS